MIMFNLGIFDNSKEYAFQNFAWSCSIQAKYIGSLLQFNTSQ